MRWETVSFVMRCARLWTVCAISSDWRERQLLVAPLRARCEGWAIQLRGCLQLKQHCDEHVPDQHRETTLHSLRMSTRGMTARISGTKSSAPLSSDRQSRLAMSPACATGSTALWTNGEHCATGARTRLPGFRPKNAPELGSTRSRSATTRFSATSSK